jgi:hypothetical protein
LTADSRRVAYDETPPEFQHAVARGVNGSSSA